MAMRSTIRSFAVCAQVFVKNRPERFSTRFERNLREVVPQYAVAIVLQFEQGFLAHG